MKILDENCNYNDKIKILEERIKSLESENSQLKQNNISTDKNNYFPGSIPIPALTTDESGNITFISEDLMKLFSGREKEIKTLNLFKHIDARKEGNTRNTEEPQQITSDNDDDTLFRDIYSNAVVGIFRISSNNGHNLANPALIKILGYNSQEELEEDKDRRWLPSVPALIRFLDSNCDSGKDCSFTRKYINPAGKQTHLRCVTRRIADSSGDTYYYEGIVEDITQVQEAHEALIEAKDKAEKSDQLKTEFLAQMSHEIRTPINTILSFASLIEQEIKSNQFEDLDLSFNCIYRAGRRVVRTIDLILHMSEIQTGNYDFQETTFDLYGDVLENLYPEYLIAANMKGIKFSINRHESDPILRCDKSSVAGIFTNLIDNAIKYTSKGEVVVNIKRNSKSQIEVEVKDTGIGIADHYLESLYKPFTQEDQGYTRRFEGNGLGLALVQKYAELNNADIKVDSKKGVGSTFKVIFN